MGNGTNVAGSAGRDLELYVPQTMSYDLVYTNTTSTKIGTLPLGAHVLDVYVSVKTAFTGSGTDLVIVGTGADDDEFASGVDVASVGVKHPTTIQTSNGAYMAAATDVYVKYTDENSNAGAGAATVVVVFISRVG
jgi:hypothetical protein